MFNIFLNDSKASTNQYWRVTQNIHAILRGGNFNLNQEYMSLISNKISRTGSVIVHRFNSDDEFYKFCKTMKTTTLTDNQTGLGYINYPLGEDEEYYTIIDPSSEIMKTGYATVGTIKIRVPNLCRFEVI